MSADVEALLIETFKADPALTGVPVEVEVPQNRPKRLITVERTGGAPDRVLDYPIVTIHAWAPTRYTASALARAIVAALRRFEVHHPKVANVSVQSIYNDPDVSESPRYRVTAQIVTHDV